MQLRRNQGRIPEIDLWHLHTYKTWTAQLPWALWVGFSLFRNRLLPVSAYIGYPGSTQILTFGLAKAKAQSF